MREIPTHCPSCGGEVDHRDEHGRCAACVGHAERARDYRDQGR